MLNKVQLIGNVGKDLELRYTQTGSAVGNFSMATSMKYEKNGEKQEQTEWHQIVCWGKLAEICKQYLSKGMKVYVEGHLKTEKWEKEGVRSQATKIIAEKILFLSRSEKVDNRQGKLESQGYEDHDDIPF